MLGIAGAQGSGKSTLARAVRERIEARGVPCALLSIDDLYLTRAERETLAARVHPLLRTRGVPGTHDVALGTRAIDALARGEAVALPRFDKSADDRMPPDQWEAAPMGTRLLILEGWCVGASPQEDTALVPPVNALEAQEDAKGRWRAHVNAALAGDYRAFFARIDALAFLAAPDFDVVERWRGEQEEGLRARGGAGVMNPAQIARFIQHYERLTRHMLADMPGRADLTLHLRPDRSVAAISPRPSSSGI